MTGLEVVALIPVAYGVLHLANKVVDLRDTINNQSARISELEGAIRNTAAAEAAGPASPSIGRVATFGGIAAASGLVVFNAWRLWGRSAGSTEQARIGPPDNYVPTPSTNEEDQCKVCWEHRRDTLVGPCNHLALCWTCASCIADAASETNRRSGGDMGQCPLCRGPIRELRFAFM